MRKSLILLIMALCYAGAGSAQDMNFDTEPMAPGKPSKKRPSLFHRPARAAPAEQLAHANALRAAGKVRKALRQYRALVHEWHNSAEAAAAQQAYAALLAERGKSQRAFEEYQYLIDNFAGGFPYQSALENQFQLARQVMTKVRGRVLGLPGFTSPARALSMFEQVADNAPNWDKAADARFYTGIIHEDEEDYDLAAIAYETVQLRYPQHPLAVEAAFRRADCLYALSNASPRDEGLCREALSALAGFLAGHPGDPNVEEAQRDLDALKQRLALMYFDRAVFYDRMKTKPTAALIAYGDFARRFPGSELADKARERIRSLEAAQGQKEQP